MNSIVSVAGVSKVFRQHRRFPGVLGAMRTLFTREFTEVAAVKEVSFEIGAGEAVGYLGPNGAGKSTMIKMMTGILVPSAGRVEVLGRTPHLKRQENARQIGVVFGQRSQLWWDLPVADSFRLHQAIYDIEKARFADNLRRVGELLELSPFLDRPVRQLSLGQRMRAEIGMALLHDPKILFLDEPTIGLDVVAKDAVRKFLATINREQGTTIVLTTHDLQDIETICPRLVMVDQGQKIFDGALKDLRASLGSARRLTLVFSSDPGALQLSTARLASDEGFRKHYVLDREDITLVDVLGELGNGHDLKDITLDEPDIEEVIRTFYQRRAGSVAERA
jgi:ABC-2 type transport system ATP-binding protein